MEAEKVEGENGFKRTISELEVREDGERKDTHVLSLSSASLPFPVLCLVGGATPTSQLKAADLREEREGFLPQLEELRKVREELMADNRRLAEMLVSTEGESEEAARVLENLTRERKELKSRCLQLQERGEKNSVLIGLLLASLPNVLSISFFSPLSSFSSLLFLPP